MWSFVSTDISIPISNEVIINNNRFENIDFSGGVVYGNFAVINFAINEFFNKLHTTMSILSDSFGKILKGLS
jgi:hypothetical protein